MVTREDEVFVARCLDAEVASDGDTEEEAVANLKEALELYFEGDDSRSEPCGREVKFAIFLDLDGVLHRELRQSDYQYEGPRLVIADNGALFEWLPALLAVIGDHPVRLVIHSSWRHLYSKDELLARLPAPLRERVLGVTEGGDRLRSILDYVERHGIDRFVVLDDVPDAFPAAWPNLIVCDPARGVTDPGVQTAIRQFLGRADGDGKP